MACIDFPCCGHAPGECPAPFTPRTPHYDDPGYWLGAAKYAGPCGACGRRVPKGERVLYFRRGRFIYCQACGEQYQRDQAAAQFDEDQYAAGRVV